MGLFDRLKEGLAKTRDNFTGKLEQVFSFNKAVDEDLFEELEEVMILSDIGVKTTGTIMEKLRDKVKREHIKDSSEVKNVLKDILLELVGDSKQDIMPDKTPAIYVVVGVNGAGKTTSIGKMAGYLKNKGLSVLMAAGDTFRAAAIDQLNVWGNRCSVDVIKHSEGSDPAAVIYDAIQAAKARKTDVLICDTAGRLHNKKNLMEELKKINRVVEREYVEADKKTLLVLDATTGQNALNQAREFIEASDVEGIILTKLDGTAKGGIVIAIGNELNVPVKMIGVGESLEDLQEFDPKAFIEAILNC